MSPRSRAVRVPRQAQLHSMLEQGRRKFGVPGAAVGVVAEGRQVVAVTGVTSVDNPLPITDRTLFMVGSTTKTFTATAVMRLVEDGRLSLDDTVIKHLPRFRLKDLATTRALTVRHLLTHTGGWDGDIDVDTGWGDDALEKYVRLARQQPQVVPLGTVWSYNNAGFSIAGRLIEVVTGLTYEAAVKRLVLDPLGMTESYLFPTEVLTRRFAIGHTSAGKRASVAHTWGLARGITPAGGIISSVRDQLKYARFHMGDGRGAGGQRVLKPATLRLMQRDHFPAGNFADAVGLSWMLKDVGGVRTVAHGGNVSNLHVSTFLMVPALGFAVTILTNSTSGGALAHSLEQEILEHFAGLREEPPAVMTAPAAALQEYAGTYVAQARETEVRVNGTRLAAVSRFNVDIDKVPEAERELVRRLLAARPPRLAMGFYAPDRAVVLSSPGKGTRVEFLRDGPGGRVRWLRSGGRLAVRK